MTFPTRAIFIGGIGCIVCIIAGLAQPKYSPTILEKWGEEGYELISSKDREDEIWKNRANLYKTNKWFLNDLSKKSLDTNGQKIKEKCEYYKNKKIRLKYIGEENYEKITLLCTLNIREYIESHLNEKESLLTSANSKVDWVNNFKKYEEKIKKEFKATTEEEKHKMLSEFCENTFKLQHANKHKEKRLKANLWCVKREEKPIVTKGTS